MSSAAERSVEGTSTGEPGKGVRATAKSIYKFTRPHTIRGTILASLTGVARALIETPTAVELRLIPRAIMGMLALLLGNAYIVGINQIYDVDVDRINKPFLPMAAGEMGKKAAWAVVLTSMICGPLIVSQLFSPVIMGLYCFGLVIGGLYSVPPFQTKRNPFLAGLTIACVRGFLLNFGVYYAVKEALGIPFKWNRAVIFLARFMTVFAGVIAVTKDLPDVEGDKQYNISTFAVRAGVARIANAACIVLGLNYVSAIVEAALVPAFNKAIMIAGHSAFALYLYRARTKLQPDSKESVKAFYARIWDLFYLEYLLYPFI
ncbi:tocopherol polyprenyltransferase-like protein [Tribonema minus]|uniref:Tocopherol polyprenyltransferase-like protein n=1 Tax=Tribonema minus TaxID=303371 RepID=A0A835YU62_9STRA|nr:tocopherol polyprenyltransferase-like protein [Tribonema minus]